MNKRRFRLEQVLAHKKRLEETMQLHLANLEDQRRREVDTLAMLERRVMEQRQALRNGQDTSRLDPEAMERALVYLDALDRDCRRQSNLVDQLAQQVHESREQLLGIAQEKKMLERLKEQELARWAVEEKRAELRQTDELNMARISRRTA